MFFFHIRLNPKMEIYKYTDTDIDIWDMHYLSLKCVENNAKLVVFDGKTYKQWPYLIWPMYATFLIWIAKSRYHLSVAFESNRISLNFHESWIKSIDLNENTLKIVWIFDDFEKTCLARSKQTPFMNDYFQQKILR